MAAQIETAKTQRRQLVWCDRHPVLRRGGLIRVDDPLRLARAEGLSDQEILDLAGSWQACRWPMR
jgi:hypothetical protein